MTNKQYARPIAELACDLADKSLAWKARALVAERALRTIADTFADQTINQVNAIELMGDTADAALAEITRLQREEG